MIDYLLFPFKAIPSLFWCLWNGLKECRFVLLAHWRWIEIKHGKADTTSLEHWLWELDQEAEMPDLWDSVSFWHECWGVIEDITTWDDNTLRFDVRVTSTPAQRYLRPHEIDKIIPRHQGTEQAAS